MVGGPALRLRGIGVCDKHCFFNCKHLSQLVLLSDRKHFVLAEAHGTQATPCFCFLLALDASSCVEFSIIRLQGVRCTWLCGRGETIFAKADTRDVLRDVVDAKVRLKGDTRPYHLQRTSSNTYDRARYSPASPDHLAQSTSTSTSQGIYCGQIRLSHHLICNTTSEE